MKNYRNADDYIISQPPDSREMLEQIRGIIWSVAPKAEEVISYGIISYKYHGMLVGIGTHKAGCSFYAMSAKILSSFSKELKKSKYSGGTIHFKYEEKLPVALIKKIIKQRMKENEAKALLKKQSTSKKSNSKK